MMQKGAAALADHDTGDLPASPAVALVLSAHPPAVAAGHRPRRPHLGRRPLTWVVAVAIALVPVLGFGSSYAGSGSPDTLALVVAVAADQAVTHELLTASQHEASLAVDWIQQQTGRNLRGDVSRAELVRLPLPEAELRGSTLAATRTILAQVRGKGRSSMYPVVITPVSTQTLAGSIQPCARGSSVGLVVFLGNCPDLPSVESVWGSPISRRVAHEVVHGLGAVPDCAPNGTTSGHVLDDPADIMYGGQEQIDPLTTAITLDAARDDYFAHGNVGCPDILDSPLWAG